VFSQPSSSRRLTDADFQKHQLRDFLRLEAQMPFSPYQPQYSVLMIGKRVPAGKQAGCGLNDRSVNLFPIGKTRFPQALATAYGLNTTRGQQIWN
jgi:hypothetical protein